MTARQARPADLAAALRVWRLANTARGRAPDPDRIARVRAKLTEPGALVLVAQQDGETIGMALAEPGRDTDGSGAPLPGVCHISMVFVHPDHWGRHVGQQLLDALGEQAGGRGYRMLQLWTGQANDRARRLYQRAGFQPTGRTKKHGGQTIIQYWKSTVDGPGGR
ncbi:MAG: GNAT family N-acetyltransferase [Micromonosporaceae bacterium]|nr:GNAT family N-acetyltransferase [Micromonosporaceae bacterium]